MNESSSSAGPRPAKRLKRQRGMPHAIVMMLGIITAAVLLTYIVPAGEYQRTGNALVVPGTYHVIPKDIAGASLGNQTSSDSLAYPASPVAIVTSIPAGMTRSAPLIFMILFIGGMFGVLQQTGALETGVNRLVEATKGNVNVIVPVLMIALAAGSTFLGLISEYLVVIPMMLLLAERLELDALFGTAVVTVAAKIGYLTSVTNPLALVVAQPLVGVPVFSGAGFRAVTFVVMLPVGIWYVLRYVKGLKRSGVATAANPRTPPSPRETPPLSPAHVMILLLLVATIIGMIYGVRFLNWGNLELAALYIALALAIAFVGRLGSRSAAESFLRGMQAMLLPAILVGLASAVEIILHDAKILDSIIAFLTGSIQGKPPVIVAQLMVFIQMAIDVFIPSTSGKAAVTMPILGPIGHLAGVSGHATVQAFLFGNGLTNTITPTSGMLLAYLAMGRISFGKWIRFILPLVAILTVLCLAAISIAVLIGY